MWGVKNGHDMERNGNSTFGYKLKLETTNKNPR